MSKTYEHSLCAEYDPDTTHPADAIRDEINLRLSIGELEECETYREPILVRLRPSRPISVLETVPDEECQITLKENDNGNAYRAECSLNVFNAVERWHEYEVIVHDCK